MIRTQIQLTEEQVRALRRLAVLQGLSMAELIRRGVEMLIDSTGEEERKRRIEEAIRIAGRFSSGKHDVSERHDDYFVEDEP